MSLQRSASSRRSVADVIDPEPRTGLDGNAVSFVHPDSVHGVLVEVIGG
jgi:hypothetical protein